MTGCGKSEQQISPNQYRNTHLVDLSEINKEDFSFSDDDVSEINNGEDTDTRWSPKGNYTYVADVKGYNTALIRVNSMDIDKSEAEVSYVLGKEDGSTVNSEGIRKCSVNYSEGDEGYRKYEIRIDENMSLEFYGTVSERYAYFICNGTKYRLKNEGG